MFDLVLVHVLFGSKKTESLGFVLPNKQKDSSNNSFSCSSAIIKDNFARFHATALSSSAVSANGHLSLNF